MFFNMHHFSKPFQITFYYCKINRVINKQQQQKWVEMYKLEDKKNTERVRAKNKRGDSVRHYLNEEKGLPLLKLEWWRNLSDRYG